MSVVLIVSLLPLLLIGRSVSDCDDIECNQIEEYPDSSVVFSAVIFRHGDRAPELPEVYANDPYKSEERYWPGGFGNLLKRGRQREYTLGKFLRHRYSMLLPETYYYHDINVTSSDLDRTITSALCVLAGLYLPQAYDHDMDSDIVAPVIPVHAINMNNDMYIMFKKNCPRYAKELDSARELKYNETLSQGMGPVYDYLTKYTGQTIDCITDVNRIHTALLIQREQGYPAPAWTQGPQYPLQQIEYIGGLSFYVRANSKVQQRLAGGPLVTKIIDAMLNKRNGSLSPDYKMMLFSGHDTTVSIILHTLGYDKVVKPDFGSSIIFELHCINNQYYVKVFFKPSGFSNQMIPVQFPSCHLPTMCSLDEFKAVHEHLRISIDQWMHECRDGFDGMSNGFTIIC
uniref:acid phosphatase n=1 Tax=Cacopsylla melanoneura TaxID=428564 RepID=A0A8D8R8V8_9HEMI